MEVEGNNRVHIRGIDKQKVGNWPPRCARYARPMRIKKKESATKARSCTSSQERQRPGRLRPVTVIVDFL